jgi:hypothetical protein
MAHISALCRVGTLKMLLACLVAGGVASTVLAFHLLSVPELGFSVEQRDGDVRVFAATSPVLLAWSMLSVTSAGAFMRIKYSPRPLRPAVWTRRAAALVLDLVFFMTATIGVVTLAPLTVESVRTGHFAWQFTRQYAVWQDHVVSSVAVAAILALFMAYRAWPIHHGTQTLGGVPG